MKKLIILGTNYYQLPLVQKAKELGYETHLFGIGTGSEEQKRLGTIATSFSDYYYPISVYDEESILKIAQYIQPAGIVSIAADTVVKTWANLNKKLNLVGNSPECALVSTNKYEMKKRLPATTEFIYTDKVEELPFDYPVVVKSVDRSGKEGITKVSRKEELESAIQYALESNHDCDKVLVEKYAEGVEYSAECISFCGKHTLLNFTEKWNFPPNYVEKMHLQPMNLDKQSVIFAGLDALGIEYGASHTEFKIDTDGNVNIIEIASRMAAENMCDLVEISTGLDYLKAVIDIAVGNIPDLSVRKTGRVAAVKYLITESDFGNLEWIEEEHPGVIYRKSPVIEPFTGRPMLKNADRYGFYVLNCSSREEILNLLGE